jgi:hypothetical protein
MMVKNYAAFQIRTYRAAAKPIRGLREEMGDK